MKPNRVLELWALLGKLQKQAHEARRQADHFAEVGSGSLCVFHLQNALRREDIVRTCYRRIAWHSSRQDLERRDDRHCNEAFQAGNDAAMNGLEIFRNPFPQHSHEYLSWDSGWTRGKNRSVGDSRIEYRFNAV